MNKAGLHCVKYLKDTHNSINMKSKYDIDEINIQYSNCIDCDFRKIATIDEEDLNYFLKELSIKEK